MEFEGPRGPRAGAPVPRGPRALVKRVFLTDNGVVPLAPTGRSSCPRCLSDTILARSRMLFSFSSLQDPRQSAGQSEARGCPRLSRALLCRAQQSSPEGPCADSSRTPRPHPTHPR